MGGIDSPVLATVIPIFNESKYIEKCLKSLIEQTLESSKHLVLVIDGGSTDASIKIVKSMAELSKSKGGPEIILKDNPVFK